MLASALPMEYSDSILLPKAYDIIWSLIPLVFLLTLLIPVAGFFIWLVYMAVKYPRLSPAGAATGPGETRTEGRIL